MNKAIDICTLTGACCVALGEYMAGMLFFKYWFSVGLFSNSDALSSSIIKAGDNVFERCWRLPILPEHTEEIKVCSDATQSFSIGFFRCRSPIDGCWPIWRCLHRYVSFNKRWKCLAAAFLKEFVPPDCQWAHLDIAGIDCLLCDSCRPWNVFQGARIYVH